MSEKIYSEDFTRANSKKLAADSHNRRQKLVFKTEKEKKRLRIIKEQHKRVIIRQGLNPKYVLNSKSQIF